MRRLLRDLILGLSFIFSTLAAYGQQTYSNVVTYSFTGNPGTKTVDSGAPFMITGGNFSVTGATENAQNNTFRTQGWPTTSTINTGYYYEVTVTAAAGYKIDFTAFKFTAKPNTTNGPTSWSLRSGTFSSDIQSGTGLTRNSVNSISADISSLTNATGGTTFRLYFYNALAGDLLELDNVAITGTINSTSTPLAKYSFTTNANADAGGPSSLVPSAVSVTGVTDGGVTGGAYRTSLWPNGGINTGDYYEITITPNSGYKIDFTSIIYDATPDATNGATAWSVRTGAFSADAGSGTNLTLGVANTNLSTDISSLTNVTAATTFRFYFYSSGSGDLLDLDNVRINGTISSYAPTAQISTLTFSGISNSAMTANWTPASGASNTGTNRLVIARLGGPVTSVPSPNTSYTANAAFGTVGTDQMVAGDFVLYNGTGLSVPVTGLGNGEYYFKVFTFNGAPGEEKYNTTSPVTAQQGTVPSAQPTALTFTSLLNTGLGYTVGWTPVSGVTGYIAIRKSGSTPTRTASTPVDGTTYTVGNSLLGGNVAYVGSGSSFAESALTAATDYFYDVYSYNGSGTGITYLTGATPTPLAGDRFTLDVEPTVQASNIIFSGLNTGAGTMVLTWTNGTNPGNQRIVIGRDGSAVSYVPVDGGPVPATASLDITNGGSDITGFSGNHFLYLGSSNTITVTNLVAGHQYFFQVFEVNGSATTSNYLTTTATNNPNRTSFTTQATNIAFANNTNTTVDVSFTNGGGASRIVVARAGSAVNAYPTDGVAYPVNPFGTGASQIGTGNYVVANSTGSTVTGLTANTNYFFTVFEKDASNNYVLSTSTGNDYTQNTYAANSPANHVTALATGTITSSAIPLNWTGSAGVPAPAKYLLLGRDVTAAGTFATVTQNATIGNQTDISAANAATNINFGTNTFTGWTNMVAGHQYQFIIYPYTTGGNLRPTADYLIASAPTISAYTEPAAQPTTFVFSNIQSNSFDVSFTGEATASGYIVIRNTTGVFTGTPSDGVQYTVGGSLGSDVIVSVGSSVSFSEAGLLASTTYYYRAFAYSGLATAPNYLTSGPLNGSQMTAPPATIGTVVAGPGPLLNSVSSLTNSQGAADLLSASFDFTITDDGGAGGDLSRTKISSITINRDAAGAIANLSSVLAGAELSDGTNPAVTATSITANTIVFSGLTTTDGALGDIADNAPKTYTLRIWLSNSLSAGLKTSIDGQNFVFNITTTDVTIVSGFSGLAAAQSVQSPTTLKNIVDVTATALSFVQQPTAVLIQNVMSPSVTVQAVDANGNRDLGVTSTIGITSTGTLSVSPTNATFVSGLGTYSIVHTTTAAGRTLTTNSGTLSNPTSSSFNITASNTSDIAVNGGFAYPQNIAYDTFQESIDITNSGSSLVVAKFDIRDGGSTLTDTDGAGTALSQLALDLGSNYTMFRRIALYDATGTTEIPGTEQAVSTQIVTFTGLGTSLIATDNNFASFTVRVSFKTTVTDNAQFAFTVTSPTFAVPNTSSAFATGGAGNAGGAVTSTAGNNNRIEVVAIKFLFVQQPTNTYVGAVMTPSPTVQAIDALNNQDQDFTGTVPVQSIGSMVPPTASATFVSGLGTYPGLIHNAAAANIWLYTNHPTMTNVGSMIFEVIAKSSDIIANSFFIYPFNIPYNNYQENVNITNSGTSLVVGEFDIRDGAGVADGDLEPTILNSISLDLGPNYTFIRRIALYDASGTVEIPGTEQVVSSQIVNFGGLNITAPDNGITSFTVRVSFTTTVVDNQQFSLTVSSATAQNGTSLFSSANAGGAFTSTAGNNNMIAVTATQLRFVQQPSNAWLLVNMTPAVTVEATDNLNSRDLDFAGTVTLLSTGSVSSTPSALFASGLGTYSTINHNTTGTGLTLTTSNASGLSNAISSPFNINASNSSDIVVNAGFVYPQNIQYANFQEAVDLIATPGVTTSTIIAMLDIRDGGGVADADGAPTRFTSLTLDLGSNWQFLRRIAVNNQALTAELPGSDVPVTGQFVTMTGNIFIGDNSTFTIAIRASFTTNVVDNQQFQIKVTGSTTLAGTSSLYAAPDAGGATSSVAGDNNRIEVIASKLLYTTNLTSPLLASVNIGSQQAVPVLKALDGFNNLDLDYATPVSLSAGIAFAPTTLNSDNTAPNAGVYTFPAGFQYSQTGNGTLTANSGVLTGIASNPVTVQAGVATAIAAGASAPATISSLVNTSGAAVAVFNFDVVDDKTPVAPTNNDGLPTLINQITITANATFNTITDWTQALAGAILTDGNGHSQNATTITANSITFQFIPVAVNTLGYVPDDGTQNYTLKVYLKSALGGLLPSTIDGLQFQFEVLSSNMVISSNSTGIIGAQAVNSGNKDVVTVDATQLRFTYPTGTTSASLNTAFPGVTLEATDANFNRDLGFTGANATITALSNTSGQTMQNGPTVGTSQFSNGVYTFPATFKYTTGVNGDDVTLSVKAGTGTTCGTNALCISPSTTPASPTITLLSSFESAIVGDPTYIIQPTLDYVNHQENTNITTSATSLEIGRALLVDGSRTNYSYGSAILTTGTDMDGLPNQDQDGASTVLNSLTLRITNPSNIRRIALYNGGTEIPGTEQAVTSPAGTPYVDIVFTGAPLLTAADDSQQDISVRVSFRGTAPEVTDHDMIQISVIAASLGVGSGFYNGGPGYIAGVNGGIATPPTMNHIDVLATKLDFTTQPSAYAGISPEPVNAGIIHANDQLGILDLDYNQPILLSTPTAATSGSFIFVNGVANLSSMLYTSAGDGTITATSGSLASNTNNTVNGLPNVSVQCSHVDVIHVSTVIATGGVITTTNLAGNSTNKVIFGFTFNTPYTVGSEPKLKTFTISFSNNVTGVLNNLRIYESATSTSYNVATVQDVELSPIGATKTVGSNSVTIDFTAASGGLRNLNNPLLTYFLMVDVDPTASASTPSVTPSVIDAGFGSLTNNNITITPVGASSMSNTVGQTYTFASIFPPILTASNPSQGQLNVNPNQSTIDLYFTVPVWSLDQKIELYDQTAGTGPFICTLAGTSGSNGSPAGTTSALVNPLKFTVPIALTPDHVYYVLVAPGVNNSSSGIFKGVMDEGLNLFPGITDPGTLYFKAASPNPPKLLSSPIAANPTISSISLSGAIINATFDQRGTAYFLVLTSGSAKPTIAQMNGSSAYAGSIAQGKINIAQTVPVSQSGIIAPTANLVNGQSYDVWMYAENDALPTPFPTADAYGSSTYGYAVIGGAVVGPTMTFTATPGSSSVSLNNPTVTLCNNSYQVLNTPIIISEGQTSQFSASGVQTLNLVLPAGFQFDVTLSGTVPKYGTITLQGADFTAGSGTLGFLGTSILTISYKNNGSSSLDKIILTGLRVKSTTATNGAIFRLGGNALTAAIPDISIMATLSSFDAPSIAFNNSYSGSVFPVITSIPDNYTNAITLTPTTVTGGPLYGPTIPPTQIPDYGPSAFSGPGVNGNVFTTSAVTLDAPFNITITHTDDNGCISANAIQYTVYDHNTAINITDSGGTPITSREYCADNDNFVTAPITVVIPPINSPTYGRAGHVRYIKHDNLSSFWLKNLTADLPVGAPPQLMSGTDWSNVVKTLPNLFSTSTNGAGTFPNYNFDDAVIANASAVSGGILPDPYSYFENVIVSTDGTNRKFRYYKGGSLGSVAFTGTFQSRTNSAVIVPRVQLVDFYLPAVPIIDVSVPSTIDNADPLTLVGAANNPNNPINIGTPVYCEAGGAINIAGYPAADGVNSTGTWVLEDPATNTVIPSPPGFTAFTNGTATLDPKAFINGLKALPTPPAYLYGDIRIRYNYQETNAVCPSTTTRIIRITPNPIGGFVQNAVISQFTPNNTSYCAGKQINFDATNTTLANAPAGTPANSITAYDWDFGDPNSSTNKVSGKLQNHTFGNPQSYIVVLNAISNWGCKSSDVAVTTTTLVVGNIPTVKMYFDGVYKQSNFTFYSNNSTVAANDFFQRVDVNYGDGTSGFATYAAGSQPTDPKTQFTHQYSTKGKYAVNLQVTSQIGCVNSLTLDNKYIKGYSDLDNKRTRTLLVLDRVPVTTSATGYLENFESGDGNWQAWYASNSTYPLTFPIDPYTKSITWASGKPTGPVIKPDASGLNGTNYWRTGYDSTNNVVGNYGNNERTALYSPSFDLSALSTPMISYNNVIQLEASDGIILEYSTDNLNVADPSKVWKVLGSTIGEGVSWFTDKGIAAKPGAQSGNDFGWTGSASAQWNTSKHTLDEVATSVGGGVNATNVVFRFAMASAKTNPQFEGFAVDNVRIGERTRTILLESFASTSNSSSSEKSENQAIAAFYPLGTSTGTQVIKINYHMNFPANDPFNLDNAADPSSRALYYGIQSTPKSILDGSPDKDDRLFSVWGNSTYGTRSLALAQADIQILSSSSSSSQGVAVSPGKISFFVKVTSIFALPSTSVLQVAVLEKSVSKSILTAAQQALVKSGETDFQYILKKMLPTAKGIRFDTAWAVGKNRFFPGGGVPFEWYVDANKLYQPANDLMVVAFIQDESLLREVFQVSYVDVSSDPPVVTGLEPLPAEQVIVYPVPANHEMHIRMPGVLKQPAALQMFDQTGRITIESQIPEGADSKTLNVRDLSSGVYILQIDVGNGNFTRKKVMIVHEE